jgi:mannose-1-phosphate guanylyltransferase/mannose-6-phosphate isomerase
LIVPVVLCGGYGTRLWPLSRRLYPKQFHNLHNDNSLLQETASRARHASDTDDLIVVTNEEQKFLVAEQLDALDSLTILIEPVARNTAPAIGLAAISALRSYQDPILLVMPADHLITDTEAFRAVVLIAERWARRGNMVTFGIRPTVPETGYGYIERGGAADSSNDAFQVERFVEKPAPDLARSFVESGRHAWNSGIFMFGARTYLDELRKLAPEVYHGCIGAMADTVVSGNTVTAAVEEFCSCPSISIDYAVMEKTEKALVVPFNGAWSDIGSWSGLADALGGAPENGNISVGDVYIRDVENSYIHAGGRLVAALGVNDLIVVETDDAVLVANKDSDQNVKALVEQLRQEKRPEVEHHSRVFRPWGSFQTLELQQGFQVKRLVIKPRGSISLQLHRRRSEHWVVVRGEAWVTRGTERFRLVPNESTYIPKETQHKLENEGDCDLEIIEVQTGDYLGEDDIERFEDQYGRT